MANNDDESDKRTDELPTDPLISVEVSRKTARKAARLADDRGLAIEDALARLTAFDYPADVVAEEESGGRGYNGP